MAFNIRRQKLPLNKRCTSPFSHTLVDDGCYGRCKYCGLLKEHIDNAMNIWLLRDKIIARRKNQIPKKLTSRLKLR